MQPIPHIHQGRTLEAVLDEHGVVTVREDGRPDAQYSVADAVVLLVERSGVDNALRSTVDDAIRVLLRKHASESN